MSLLTTLMGLVKPQDNDNSRAHFVTVGAGYHANMDKLDAHTHDNDTAGAAVKRVASGLDASKPVAGNAGRVYVATDTGLMYIDTGTTWIALNLHGAGSITDAMLVSLAGGKVIGAVATATEATHAINAGWADGANNANHATEASYATNAGWADGANNANNATHAVGADDATTAINADYADHTQLAVLAISADKLTHVPACRVFHSVAQSLAHSTPVLLDFDSELFDTDSIHDLTTNRSCLTCKTAGIYIVTAAVRWFFNTTGYRMIELLRNGSFVIAHQENDASLNSQGVQHLSTIFSLDVNDYVQIRASQGSGVSLSVLSDPYSSPEFAMVRLGPNA